jgi:thiol-disulfide isomerase/thioredoxin
MRISNSGRVWLFVLLAGLWALPAVSAAAEEPAAEEKENAEKKIPGADLVASLNNESITNAFKQISAQLEEDSENVDAKFSLTNLLQQTAALLHRTGETDKAYEAYGLSAQVAHELVDSKADLPEGAEGLLQYVFYNEACVYGRKDDAAKAIESLELAVSYGFNNFDLLESDEDLTSVRADAEFEKRAEAWKAKIAEIARKHAEEELAKGESFPFEFALIDVEGNPVQLADYKGKVVIVDIWGTWCPPCRAEIPSFIKLQETYGPKGFQMVGLNYEGETGDAATKKVKDFIAETGINYPCALGDEKTQQQVPDFVGYPTTLFIDRSGKVRLKVVGLHPYPYLEAIVTTLLEEPEGTEAN